jgi:GT2 family glycosyltransferase
MKPTSRAFLAIITVGFNNQRYVKEYFDALKKSTFQDFDVIYIDNASEDETLSLVRREYPKAKLIPSQENLGFAGGNNLGISFALKEKYEYIFLLNPDTKIAPDCLEILMGQANQQEILQPLILLDDGTENTVNTAGNVIHFLGFSYCGDYNQKAQTFTEKKSISTASGAAVLFPASILKVIGAFDPTFFVYHEDVDLSWRAQKAGYSLFLIPGARVLHDYSFSRNNKKFYYAERNRLMFIAKNFGVPLLVITFPLHLINELLLCLYALVNGWLLEKLKGYLSIIRLYPDILYERKKVNSITKRSDHSLKQLFTRSIGFNEVQIPLLTVYNRFTDLYWGLTNWII